MNVRDYFVCTVANRLQDQPPEKRKLILERILKDVDDFVDPWKDLLPEVFEPLRIDLIREKQQELGLEISRPDEENCDYNDDGTIRLHFGYAPLHEAVSQGNIEMVRKFLQDGHDPFVKDNAGATPYDLSLELNNIPIIKLLQDVMN